MLSVENMENKLTFIDLTEIANGELQRIVSEEWNKVIENMQDPERPYKAKRKLVITLTCTQNEKRSAMDVEAEVKSTLAPISGVGTRFDTGRDSEGNSYAVECQTLDARQVFFEDIEDVFFSDNKTATEEVQ